MPCLLVLVPWACAEGGMNIQSVRNAAFSTGAQGLRNMRGLLGGTVK